MSKKTEFIVDITIPYTHTGHDFFQREMSLDELMGYVEQFKKFQSIIPIKAFINEKTDLKDFLEIGLNSDNPINASICKLPIHHNNFLAVDVLMVEYDDRWEFIDLRHDKILSVNKISEHEYARIY